MSATAEKLTYLEETLAQVAYAQLKTEMSLQTLSREMREFKDEMREFKNEMGEFKDEMGEYKDWSKDQIILMNRQWGDLANKMGTFVEDIVAPNLPRIARTCFGCEDLDYFAVRVKKKSCKGDGPRREFDVIAVCEGIFILNETKSSPETRDVDKLAAFVESGARFDYFPEYEGYRIVPVFASLYMDDSLVAYLTRKKIYALTLKEDTMDIVNLNGVS
ncbi:MAG: hypothetical protein K9K40_06530 [Desulfotignum sp.]|nr:hypothetical protein [Desulfotignum sp.]